MVDTRIRRCMDAGATSADVAPASRQRLVVGVFPAGEWVVTVDMYGLCGLLMKAVAGHRRWHKLPAYRIFYVLRIQNQACPCPPGFICTLQ